MPHCQSGEFSCVATSPSGHEVADRSFNHLINVSRDSGLRLDIRSAVTESEQNGNVNPTMKINAEFSLGFRFSVPSAFHPTEEARRREETGRETNGQLRVKLRGIQDKMVVQGLASSRPRPQDPFQYERPDTKQGVLR
jgi:hypothetical protein